MGLALGKRYVSMGYAKRVGADARRIEWVRRKELALPIFGSDCTEQHVEVLRSALQELGGPTAASYIPLYVALPDPLVNVTVFELDQLPASTRAQAELVRWRFAKEIYTGGRPFASACQPLGQSQDKHLLLGMAMDQSWFEGVRQACVRAGLVPWGMNISACYQHNRFYATFTRVKHGGALIALDADAWTLSLWDADGRLRLVRSRWRNGAGSELYETVASESERIILAYARGEETRAIARLYLIAATPEADALAAVLDQRLKEKVIVLPLADGYETKPSTPLDAPITAALAQ